MSREFKAGDLVRCIEGLPGVLTEGREYVVRSPDPLHGWEYVTLDVVDAVHSPLGGWAAWRFELVEGD